MILAITQATIRLLGFLILVAGLSAISACGQSENVTIHEPGVYQGAVDDLKTDEAQLKDRIKNQMDR